MLYCDTGPLNIRYPCVNYLPVQQNLAAGRRRWASRSPVSTAAQAIYSHDSQEHTTMTAIRRPTRLRSRWAFLICLTMLSMLLAACGGSGQPKTYTIGVAIEAKPLAELFT